ncbi:hypothetical protein R1flu_006311 [Riccia fluitans]|uniref:F-box protein n=1 Tax=Riccia fluitans TaxID=41844 RepID=A0ABD1YVN0_9MARC
MMQTDNRKNYPLAAAGRIISPEDPLILNLDKRVTCIAEDWRYGLRGEASAVQKLEPVERLLWLVRIEIDPVVLVFSWSSVCQVSRSWKNQLSSETEDHFQKEGQKFFLAPGVRQRVSGWLMLVIFTRQSCALFTKEETVLAKAAPSPKEKQNFEGLRAVVDLSRAALFDLESFKFDAVKMRSLRFTTRKIDTFRVVSYGCLNLPNDLIDAIVRQSCLNSGPME